jgi:ComF family protein
MCAVVRPTLDGLVAVALLDGPLREAVHRFKYRDRPGLAGPLVAALRPNIGQLPPGVLVPVPITPERRRERGYNQALLVAQALGRAYGREVVDGLSRQPGLGHQVGRTGEARRALVTGFSWIGGQAPSEVLLVDDVTTTGTTLATCGAALREFGAARVRGLALALG